MSGVIQFRCPVHGWIGQRIDDGYLHPDPMVCTVLVQNHEGQIMESCMRPIEVYVPSPGWERWPLRSSQEDQLS